MTEFFLIIIVLIVILLILKSKGKLTIHSHWNTLVAIQFSSKEYFECIKNKLKASGVDSISYDMVDLHERAFGYSQRSYLEISYQNFVFYVCGSPFGQHFFVSYWGHFKTTQAEKILRSFPFFGNYLANKFYAITYYQYDQCSAFMTLLHTHITETIEEMTNKQGVPMPSLPKPIMNDVFKR